jgi:hypothetical protein
MPAGGTVTGTGVAKDLDGDGIVDLALGVFPLGVDVYLGLPGGGFADPIHSPIATSSNGGAAMVAGTFRLDGGIDLLLSLGTVPALALLINQGGGKFGDEIHFPIRSNDYYAPVAADFNGDGWLDVAYAGNDGLIGVVFNLGQGDGRLGNELTLDPGPPVELLGVAVGDFNGDGMMDLAASSLGSFGKIPIFLGAGNGEFRTPILNTAVYSPSQIAAGRLARGPSDALALGSYDQFDVYVIEDQLGGLAAATPYPTDNIINGGVLSIADIDGDGAQDIIQAGPGLLVVLFNRGDGTFWPSVTVPISMSDTDMFQDVIVGDLNSDGAIDVAWVPLQGSWTEILNGCP